MAWQTRCPAPGCELPVNAVDTATEHLQADQSDDKVAARHIESYCDDDHACVVADARWEDGQWHVRTIDSGPDREQTDDPRGAGGGMVGAGGSQERDSVIYDARRAVLVEQYEVAVAHTSHCGQPGPDRVALLVRGRINRPPDDQTQQEAPAEQVEHLHMTSWEQAAALVAELYALASRDAPGRLGQFTDLVKRNWESLEGRGHT